MTRREVQSARHCATIAKARMARGREADGKLRPTDLPCFAPSRLRDCDQRRAATSPIAWSRISSALSACALVITSDGDRRMAFLPAPSTSRPL